MHDWGTPAHHMLCETSAIWVGASLAGPPSTFTPAIVEMARAEYDAD